MGATIKYKQGFKIETHHVDPAQDAHGSGNNTRLRFTKDKLCFLLTIDKNDLTPVNFNATSNMAAAC